MVIRGVDYFGFFFGAAAFFAGPHLLTHVAIGVSVRGKQSEGGAIV
jgi:hypothetical protein